MNFSLNAFALPKQRSTQILYAAIGLVLFFAAFLRLYKLSETLVFQADQGRDALIVSKIFKDANPVLIGPVTSVGNLYLGPGYYYFMLPWLWLTYPNPIGPAYGVALLGVLTVWLMYFFGKDMVGKYPALFAAATTAFSAVLIQFSRFSWNPNIAPLFCLCMAYFTWKAWKDSPKWWIGVSVCFAVLLQLHYLTILTLGGAGIIWLLQLYGIVRKYPKSVPSLSNFIFMTVISVLVTVVSFGPIVLFDIRHGGSLRASFEKIFVSEKVVGDLQGNRISDSIKAIVIESHGRTIEVLFNNFTGKNAVINNILLLLVCCATVFFILRALQEKKPSAVIVLVAYLFSGIIGLSAYRYSVFVHYILFLLPLSMLYISYILFEALKVKAGWVLLSAWLVLFVIFNYQPKVFTVFPWTLTRAQELATHISSRLQPGEVYDVLLLSESGDNWGFTYRYWLSTTPTPPLPAESGQNVETLVVVNENNIGKKISELAIYPLQIFPKDRTEERFTIEDGPEIIILRVKK